MVARLKGKLVAKSIGLTQSQKRRSEKKKTVESCQRQEKAMRQKKKKVKKEIEGIPEIIEISYGLSSTLSHPTRTYSVKYMHMHLLLKEKPWPPSSLRTTSPDVSAHREIFFGQVYSVRRVTHTKKRQTLPTADSRQGRLKMVG